MNKPKVGQIVYGLCVAENGCFACEVPKFERFPFSNEHVVVDVDKDFFVVSNYGKDAIRTDILPYVTASMSNWRSTDKIMGEFNIFYYRFFETIDDLKIAGAEERQKVLDFEANNKKWLDAQFQQAEDALREDANIRALKKEIVDNLRRNNAKLSEQLGFEGV